MIAGLQKMTLLDFPGRVACTVFLEGCNFRCPFCHNAELLPGGGEAFMTVEAFLDFLRGRHGLLDGVCITGGEPTLQKGLADLAAGIKELGFAVKLDTNGSRPEVLRELVEKQLLDYVAMDVKHSPGGYGAITGVPHLSLAPIEESLKFLLSDVVDYELRTTLVDEFHNDESIVEMGQWLASLVPGKRPKNLYLQSFVDRDTVMYAGLHAPGAEASARYAKLLSPYAENVSVRNT